MYTWLHVADEIFQINKYVNDFNPIILQNIF